MFDWVLYNQLEDYSIRHTYIQYYRSKHIEIKHHFIRDHVKMEDMESKFIETQLQLANIFTKPLVDDRFNFIKNKLFIAQNPNFC